MGDGSGLNQITYGGWCWCGADVVGSASDDRVEVMGGGAASRSLCGRMKGEQK